MRRGLFRSVPEPEQAIGDFLDVHNPDPKPFVWTARVEDILAKVLKYRAILEIGQKFNLDQSINNHILAVWLASGVTKGKETYGLSGTGLRHR